MAAMTQLLDGVRRNPRDTAAAEILLQEYEEYADGGGLERDFIQAIRETELGVEALRDFGRRLGELGQTDRRKRFERALQVEGISLEAPARVAARTLAPVTPVPAPAAQVYGSPQPRNAADPANGLVSDDKWGAFARNLEVSGNVEAVVASSEPARVPAAVSPRGATPSSRPLVPTTMPPTVLTGQQRPVAMTPSPLLSTAFDDGPSALGEDPPASTRRELRQTGGRLVVTNRYDAVVANERSSRSRRNVALVIAAVVALMVLGAVLMTLVTPDDAAPANEDGAWTTTPGVVE